MSEVPLYPSSGEGFMFDLGSYRRSVCAYSPLRGYIGYLTFKKMHPPSTLPYAYA